jgi:hypothetical protein
MMTALSIAGLLFPEALYPAEEVRRSFVSNDLVNLMVGLPVLLGSIWFARRGSLAGMLFWPGALLYITYNSLAYAAAMPFTWMFTAFFSLALLSGLAVYRLLASLNLAAVAGRLFGKVPERFAGGVLAGFGLLFFLRALAEFFDSAADMAAFGVIVADLFITPLWVIGGVQLWRKRPLGYAAGAGLLFQASMLFAALLVFFVLQPFLADVSFPLADFLVIFAMGLVVFIPLGMFARGCLSAGKG